VIFVKNTKNCQQRGFDPGTSRATVRHADTNCESDVRAIYLIAKQRHDKLSRLEDTHHRRDQRIVGFLQYIPQKNITQ